jgi:hypothetical protein
MKKNMGRPDQRIRSVIAIIFSILFFGGVVTGVWGNVIFTIALVFFATSILRVCPLYSLLGISTCNVKSTKP